MINRNTEQSPRRYASLAIYGPFSNRDDLNLGPEFNTKISDLGRDFKIYSTQELHMLKSIEEHLEHIATTFRTQLDSFSAMAMDGFEFRVWIYLDVNEPNFSFVVSERFLKWIGTFQADLVVDIWRDA